MSRPKPTITLEYTNPRSYVSEQVIMASAVFAVFYDKQPITVRTLNSYSVDPATKYKKTSFPNAAHAFNLAEKLNKLFKTDKFEVYMLKEGVKITEDADE